jgi:hypothetical protein
MSQENVEIVRAALERGTRGTWTLGARGAPGDVGAPRVTSHRNSYLHLTFRHCSGQALPAARL